MALQSREGVCGITIIFTIPVHFLTDTFYMHNANTSNKELICNNPVANIQVPILYLYVIFPLNKARGPSWHQNRSIPKSDQNETVKLNTVVIHDLRSMTSTMVIPGLGQYIRGLSGKYADTVNCEAKTSNNMELLLFVLSGTI